MRRSRLRSATRFSDSDALLGQLRRNVVLGIEAFEKVGGLHLNVHIRDSPASLQSLVSIHGIPVSKEWEAEFLLRVRQCHRRHSAGVVAPVTAGGFFADEDRAVKVVQNRADISRAGE